MKTAIEIYKENLKQHLINHHIELGLKNAFTPEQNANIYMEEHSQRIEQEFEGLRFTTDLEYIETKK